MASSARVIQFPFVRRIDFAAASSEHVGADFTESFGATGPVDRGVLRGPPEFEDDVEAGAVDVAAQIFVEGIPT